MGVTTKIAALNTLKDGAILDAQIKATFFYVLKGGCESKHEYKSNI